MDIKELVEKNIRTIPDFPKKGIQFKDITTLLNNKVVFKKIIDHLEKRYNNKHLDFVVGIESRGFIFGSALAYALKKGFVPIRKKGKLPAETINQKYELEYGFSDIEIHKDAFKDIKKPKIVLIDDLLATGGTAKAAINILEKLNADIIEISFIIELGFLNGREKIKKDIYSILMID
jgi:adenine phosphoribosyltransferase